MKTEEEAEQHRQIVERAAKKKAKKTANAPAVAEQELAAQKEAELVETEAQHLCRRLLEEITQLPPSSLRSTFRPKQFP